MSPYLFTIVMEVLTLMLQRKVKESSVFRYHWGCEKLGIISLCFADDLLMYFHGDSQSIKLIKESLDEFSSVSGLVPNLLKSTIYFSNVLPFTKKIILNLLPFKEGKLPVRYLGIPLLSKRLYTKDCDLLILKVKKRVNDWKNKYLSFAGRLQLINSVLSSMEVFWGSVFLLPGNVIEDIERIMNRFLWAQVYGNGLLNGLLIESDMCFGFGRLKTLVKKGVQDQNLLSFRRRMLTPQSQHVNRCMVMCRWQSLNLFVNYQSLEELWLDRSMLKIWLDKVGCLLPSNLWICSHHEISVLRDTPSVEIKTGFFIRLGVWEWVIFCYNWKSELEDGCMLLTFQSQQIGLHMFFMQYGLNDAVWTVFNLQLTLKSQRFGNLNNIFVYVTIRSVGIGYLVIVRNGNWFESKDFGFIICLVWILRIKAGWNIIMRIVGLDKELVFSMMMAEDLNLGYCLWVVLRDVWAAKDFYNDVWANVVNGLVLVNVVVLGYDLNKGNAIYGYWIWSELDWCFLCGLCIVITILEEWAAHTLEGWFCFVLLFFAILMFSIVIGFVKWAIRIALISTLGLKSTTLGSEILLLDNKFYSWATKFFICALNSPLG
ncbi:hypothetical protein QVD17_29540 [Tagetes erecta]|uniref:Reverse transcriptase domain-containing protein n=1 Tax=Tagetes erecta TaxID=13708 RepID=A0AAD8KGL3_TARER|nr:hypothetical protein QVD17_29540 [Tagetes erecta]